MAFELLGAAQEAARLVAACWTFLRPAPYWRRMLRQDFIKRVIRQMAQGIAAALGFKVQGEHEQALAVLADTLKSLGRVDRKLIDDLDVTTLVSLVGPDELVRQIARVLTLEGDILSEEGHAEVALRRRKRALELYEAVGDGDDIADRANMRALRRGISGDHS